MLLRRYWQCKPEGRTLSGDALDSYLALMVFDDGFADM